MSRCKKRWTSSSGDLPGTPPETFAGLHAELLADVEVWTNEPTIADLDGFAAEVEAIDR